MRSLQSNKIRLLHTNVLSWYRKHQRALLWRTTTDPYEILVSEVMLQQTQVSRVQEKLPLFLETFPSVAALAMAKKSDVLRAWQGMGYNSRAVRLRDMARKIEREFEGVVPTDITTLRSLPGVGPYTSHAVACFALKQRVPVVDVNIRRVLSRVVWKMRSVSDTRSENDVWDIAASILPRNAYQWNQALMDLGSTICTARKPLCDACPVSAHCASRNMRGNVASHAASKRGEPMFDGIPQRIWRGKIVETLRYLKGREHISLHNLGRSIRRSFHRDEAPWLASVVERLRSDGLVDVRQTGRTMFISLAHE